MGYEGSRRVWTEQIPNIPNQTWVRSEAAAECAKDEEVWMEERKCKLARKGWDVAIDQQPHSFCSCCC